MCDVIIKWVWERRGDSDGDVATSGDDVDAGGRDRLQRRTDSITQ